MDIERFRKIIKYSEDNRSNIEFKVKNFYSFMGMDRDVEVLNIIQIARASFKDKEKKYLILEIPFADSEIGALCYKGDALGYIVLNSSLPKVNVNFAICHELYHVFYQESDFRTKVEFANNHYYEHEEEFAANLFAGMLLMPESNFRFMYERFKSESKNNEIDTIIQLMNYYQVPYMAALIRCYELRLPNTDSISKELLNVGQDVIRERFNELWLDDNILNATKRDDFAHIEALVKRLGNEFVRDSYLNKRTLEKVLQNMKTLYLDIKGE